jgi:hypothetical protein
MVAPVQELIDADFNTPLVFRKEDRVWNVEKDLIAEVQQQVEKILSVEFVYIIKGNTL